jgi:DNA-binding transcriptional regulator YdaS (Cro superfamily)
MAKSKKKTRLSELRTALGNLGASSKFSKLTGISESWVKKASCGIIPVTAQKANLIEVKTGFSASWILGKSNQKAALTARPLIETLVGEFRNELKKELGLK